MPRRAPRLRRQPEPDGGEPAGRGRPSQRREAAHCRPDQGDGKLDKGGRGGERPTPTEPLEILDPPAQVGAVDERDAPALAFTRRASETSSSNSPATARCPPATP